MRAGEAIRCRLHSSRCQCCTDQSSLSQRTDYHTRLGIETPSKVSLDVNGFCVLNAQSTIDVDAVIKHMQTHDTELACFKEVEDLIYAKFHEYKRVVAMSMIVSRHETTAPVSQPRATTSASSIDYPHWSEADG